MMVDVGGIDTEIYIRNNDLPAIINNGNRFWYKNNLKHRDGDKPAVIMDNGDSYWFRNGALYREDGKPPCMYSDDDSGHGLFQRVPLADGGYKSFYGKEITQYYDKDGRLHRENGPAMVSANNSWWYRHGELHRDGDLPAVTNNGDLYWYLNGKKHRDGDKPAIIMFTGSRFWYQHGVQHRDDEKPAVIFNDGGKEVWIHGVREKKIITNLKDGNYKIDFGNVVEYYDNTGKLHRDNDEPAAIYSNGSKKWMSHGNVHRDNDKLP